MPTGGGELLREPPTSLVRQVAGIPIARRGLLTGWARWVVPVAGGYVFVVLFPAVFGPMVAGRLAIGAWMLLWAAIGWAVARRTSAPPR